MNEIEFEKLKEDVEKRMENYNEVAIANRYYDKFLEAITLRNNELINNTVVVEVLDLIIRNKSSLFRETIPIDTLLYRARTININNDFGNPAFGFNGKNNINGFNFWNSNGPPLSIAPEGRNNIQGMSYLYLASNAYTACCEVKPKFRELLSLAQFKTKREFNIIDLSADKGIQEFEAFKEKFDLSPSRLITNIMLEFSSPINEQYGYIISQFISDYFRKTGIDGIKYKSAIGDGDNITIFNSYKDYFDFIRSDIVCLWNSDNYFFDDTTQAIFNSGKSFVLNDDQKSKIHSVINDIIGQKRREWKQRN